MGLVTGHCASMLAEAGENERKREGGGTRMVGWMGGWLVGWVGGG